IVSRQESSANSGANSQNICSLITKIGKLNSGIKAIKKDILQQMEYKLNELKSSVVSFIENLGTHRTYAEAVGTPTSIPVCEHTSVRNSPDLNPVLTVSSYVDEGYGDESVIKGSTSQTQPKTLFAPDPTGNEQGPRPIFSPKPIPVRITKGNVSGQHGSKNSAAVNRIHRNISQQATSLLTPHKRTLIIGDSLLKGINNRGLKSGVKICARGGAKISDIWEEMSLFDLKSFTNVIICVGGNDCSGKSNIKSFEEAYDQLIGLIKSGNKDCLVYLCKIAPRGDTDVTDFNQSIQRIANHWKLHQVKFIDETSRLFFGQNGIPSARYFYNDGIHLNHSGIKRLVDALNRHVDIVADFTQCVFQGSNFHRQRNTRPGTNPNRQHDRRLVKGGRGRRLNGHWQNNSRGCYGCGLSGHIYADCWYSE
ncbi:MAG: SGNH/GDSL hydrolase family protein, partial [Candidatus Thiodiazotropha endolucinida]|nr:SGNH/GDSL hydrolase family protein [Candidatus Thiodiazotropha taylori]MCW4264290.1 SGNH/GDSL hydrolase family protein [Candidatus Thiodiazotropha endolucinida]